MNTIAFAAPRFRRPPPGMTQGLLLLSLALGAAFLAANLGGVALGHSDWLALLSGQGFDGLLWNLRLPRVALALAVGAALGLAGALTQGLFRNPMADPGLLGVSSGAACAVALTLTFAASLTQGLPLSWRFWALPLAGFVGALGLSLLLEQCARWLTPGSLAGLLLCGLAVNALAMAVVGLCTFVATDEQLRSLSFWTLGSLAGAQWPIVGLLALLLAWGLVQGRRDAQALNALALGEAVAGHLGLDRERLRRRLILLVALLCGVAVAWCGAIGFIGLMAPHAARALVGADQRRSLPLAMALGALLLLLADTLARTLLLPVELPVGILTALMGSPVFLLLLLRASRRGQA